MASPADPFLAGTPLRWLAALGLCLALASVLTAADVLPASALGIVGIAVGHGAMLGTALAWAGQPVSTQIAATGMVALAATSARLHPLGAVAYLAVPLWIGRLSARGRLRALGLGVPCPPRALGAGVLVGLCLGAHVLVSAALTFGYRVRLEPERYLGAVLYDVGAQVLATETFCRGAVFNRAQRRWPLGPALILATAVTLVRYLVDPLLPRKIEMVLGMAFYVSMLALATGWLFWRFGSLVPGLAATLLFFVAYRTLGAG